LRSGRPRPDSCPRCASRTRRGGSPPGPWERSSSAPPASGRPSPPRVAVARRNPPLSGVGPGAAR
jgi:hypothetical protein